MLNTEKIRFMTKAAVIEEHAEKYDREVEGLYKGDYVFSKMLRSFFIGTAAFLVIFLIYCMYDPEGVLLQIYEGRIQMLLLPGLVLYTGFIIVFMFASYLVYNERYDSGHRRIYKIRRLLGNISDIYNTKEE